MDHRVLGIACVVGAITLFILQDALIKWLSGDYPLHEIVLVRAASAIAVTLFMMRLEGGVHLLRTRRLGLQLTRSALLVFANCAFYLALAAVPIAEATSIFFVAPLLITALSALVLHEPVGPRRWAAVCVGLAGVIVMMRPGEDVLRLVALLPIVAATAYAFMQIITRRPRYHRTGLHHRLLRTGRIHRRERDDRPRGWRTDASRRKTTQASHSCCGPGRFPRPATPPCSSASA